jgi:multicomponent Na+:H+ antiporter subunit E
MSNISFQRGRSSPLQLVGLLLALMAGWLLWSGIYKPLLLGLGLFSVVLSAWLAQRMGFFRHPISLRLLLRLPAFWGWLLQEVVKSSLDVARIILTPSLPISPTIVELPAATSTEAGRAILGNSITLSPGTVTIDVHGDRLLVHCLTRESALALKELEAQRRLARLEQG